MTAGQIANELGVKEITINYMTNELLAFYLYSIKDNKYPMTKLYWTLSKGNFE